MCLTLDILTKIFTRKEKVMTSQKYLPSTNEFTPNIIDLFFCLEAIKTSNDRSQFIDKVRDEYFLEKAKTRTDPKERLIQQNKLAGNVLIGLRNYLLVKEEQIELTALGNQILNEPEKAKDVFAKHLVDILCGTEILLSMDRLKSRGVSPRNKKLLADELNSLGIQTKTGRNVSQSTTDHTKFATWLNWCEILDDSDSIIEERFHNIIGRNSGLTSSLWALSDEQFIFLKHLWEEDRTKEQSSYTVKSLVNDSKAHYGDYISKMDQIAANIIQPLEEAGFLKIHRTSEGRGGNSGSVEPTQDLSELTAKDFDNKNDNFNTDMRVTKPLSQIFEEIESEDTHIKGIALEELSILIGQSLGLKFSSFRTMSSDTGGAEVDVIFEQQGIFYSKWLVQCKNTPKSPIHVSTVAKEVGNALVNTANGVIIVTSGKFTKAAVQYAEATMIKSNLQVHLIDGELLKLYKLNGTAALVRELLVSSEKAASLRNQSII